MHSPVLLLLAGVALAQEPMPEAPVTEAPVTEAPAAPSDSTVEPPSVTPTVQWSPALEPTSTLTGAQLTAPRVRFAIEVESYGLASLLWGAQGLVSITQEGDIGLFDPQGVQLSETDVRLRWGLDAARLSGQGDQLLVTDYGQRVRVVSLTDGATTETLKPKDRWGSIQATFAGESLLLNLDGVLVLRDPSGNRRHISESWAASSHTMGQVGDSIYAPVDYTRIKVWSTSGAAVQDFDLSRSPLQIIAGDDELVATFYDGTLTRLDVATGESRDIQPAGLIGNNTTALSPDGRLCAFPFQAGVPMVRIWDMDADRLVADLPGEAAVAPAFSPDGRQLAVVDYLGGVSVWDVPEADPPRLTSTANRSPAAAWLGRDRAVVLWSTGEIWRWDLGDGARLDDLQIPLADSWEYAGNAVISSDGAHALAVSRLGVAEMYSLDDGESLKRNHPAGMYGARVALGPDGSAVVAADSRVQSFGPDGALQTTVLSDAPPYLAVGQGGRRIATGTWDTVTVRDVDTGEVRTHRFPEIGLMALGASDSGFLVVTGDGTLHEIVGDEVEALTVMEESGYGQAWVGAHGVVGLGSSLVAVTSDGARVAERSLGSAVVQPMWRGITRSETGELLLVSEGGAVVLVDGQLETLAQLAGPVTHARALASDGTRGAVALSDSTVRSFDLATGEETGRYALADQPAAVGFTQGALIVATSEPALLVLRDGAEPVHRPSEQVVVALEQTDGALLATTDYSEVRQVDASGALSGPLVPPELYLSSVAPTPSGLVGQGERFYLNDGKGWASAGPRRRQYQRVSGPMAVCPDGRFVVGTAYGWRRHADTAVSVARRPGARLKGVELGPVSPTHIVCGPDGALVASAMGELVRIDPATGSHAPVGGQAGQAPLDLLLLDGGDVLVAWSGGQVQRIGPDGSVRWTRQALGQGGWELLSADGTLTRAVAPWPERSLPDPELELELLIDPPLDAINESILEGLLLEPLIELAPE